MNLGITTTTFAASENQEWLGSAEGTQFADSITLDGPLCAAAFATGLVPSGIPLKRQGSGKYAPALDNGAGADDDVDGHLFTTIDLTNGGRNAANVDSPAALYWHGEVIFAKIPAYTGRTAVAGFAANSTLKLVRYV